MKTSVDLTRCPARIKYLALALRGYIGKATGQAVRIAENPTGGAKDEGEPCSPKFPYLVGMTVAGMALGISPAMADTICIGSGPSAEHPATIVGGQATFSFNSATNPKQLTLILTNTGAPTTLQGDMLTGVIFNIAGNPPLSYNATANPTLVPGSHTYTNNTTQNDATPLFNGSGSSWTTSF